MHVLRVDATTLGRVGWEAMKAAGGGGLRDASPVNDTLHQFRVFPGLAQVERGFQFFLQDELVLGQLLLQVSEIDC